MTRLERLPECPNPENCRPMMRSKTVCYGKNGCRQACMVRDGMLLHWEGDDAWAGPADRIEEEVTALKEEALI